MKVDLDVDGESVPAILDIPAGQTRVPGVLLIHGLGSTKEQMVASIGRGLAVRGVASLAVDLPFRTSARDGRTALAARSPFEIVLQWRLAVREANHAIAYLASLDAIDPTCIGIAGYSLGAYLALEIAATNPAVRAVCLAAGGDLPAGIPFASFARSIVDPVRSASHLGERPLLMINGLSDHRVPPPVAKLLFEAAGEPKELRWYNGGHWPPDAAIDGASEWLCDRLREAAETTVSTSAATEARRAQTREPRAS